MAREEFAYAVLQVVPSVERGERFNAGVVLFCRRQGFLAARVELSRELLALLDPAAEPGEVASHLAALAAIAAGDEDGGPVARLSQSERFHWLVAPSSTVIQPGPVHTGVTDDPGATLERLFARLVGPPGDR